MTSTLLYGYENWALIKLHVESETAEMTYQSSVTRYALYDYKINQEIKEDLNICNLSIIANKVHENLNRRNHRQVVDYMNTKYQANNAHHVLH
jgi:hypothetical protein